jgi:hypothetical protein
MKKKATRIKIYPPGLNIPVRVNNVITVYPLRLWFIRSSLSLIVLIVSLYAFICDPPPSFMLDD